MELRQVKPDDIKVPEVRVTARFDEESWEQFQGSMKEVGALAPILCIEVEGELVLVDGLHRLIEAKRNGVKLVDVAIMPGDEVDVLTKNLFLDKLRGKPPVTDMIKVIKELTEIHHLTSEQIKAKTGMTRDYVEKLQKLSELTPACLASLDEEKIGVGQAFELTRIADPVTQETVLHQQELYRWKVPALREYINDVVQLQRQQAVPPPPGVPPTEYMLECFYCHQKYPIAGIANPHTCLSCSGILLLSITTAKAETKAEEAAQKEPGG
jgi:ParB-like chromosome segregation protein Spo0J